MRTGPWLGGESTQGLPVGVRRLAPGQVRGDRYQIRAFPGWVEIPEWDP